MSNQKYFDVPFALSGDVTEIPDALQTGGTVSFTEGWGYDYQRDLSTDTAAQSIDRSTMNWLFNAITTAIAALQLGTVPEYITSAQNGGTPPTYGKGAVVLYSTTGAAPFTKYVSLVAGNTSVPGVDANWQIVSDAVATQAQAIAGTDNNAIMTALRVAQALANFNTNTLALQYAALNGNSGQPFAAAAAAAETSVAPLSQLQSGAVETVTATNPVNANTIVLTRAVPVTALTDQMKVRFKAVSANTGAVTLNDSGLGAKGLYGQGNAALVGGEIVAGGEYEAIYNSASGNYQLVAQSGGSMQIAPAMSSSQAMTLGQGQLMFTPQLGASPRLAALVTVGATSATFIDDAVTCATSLTGTSYRIPGFSATLNLSTVGIGGMDTGTATAGGFIAVYAAYNPTTLAHGVFGSMEGSVAPSTIYNGSNRPAGFTATALIAVVPAGPTAGIFNSFSIHGGIITRSLILPANQTNAPTTLSGISLSGFVPKAARKVYGSIGISNFTSAASASISVATDSNSTNQTVAAGYATSGGGFTAPFTLTLITAQVLYWFVSTNVGNAFIGISAYEI